jgi:hypothetical protein
LVKRCLLILAIAALATAAACGGDDGDTTVDLNGDGEVTAGDDLPDGWPDDFPVYGNADVTFGGRQTVDGNDSLVATWETDDDVGDVEVFYADAFQDGAWRTVRSLDVEGTYTFFIEHQDGRAGQLLVGEDEGVTTIFAAIGEEFAADGAPIGDVDETPASSPDENAGEDEDLPDRVDLPDSYPEDRVPLPEGARVTSAASSTASGVASHVVQFYSRDSIDDVDAFFKRELEGDGFSQTVQSAQGDARFLTYAEGDGISGMTVIITIANADVPGYSSTTLQVLDP